MILKRLIAISVVFALVAGTAFAADVSGSVIGTVNFLEGSVVKDADDDAKKPKASGDMQRVRLEGSGETDDGTFGGWARVDAAPGYPSTGGESFQAFGYAWWKPLDMLKLTIGGNPDGFYGKEGVTGWMFYQTASDTGVVNPNTVWYAPGSHYQHGLQTRDAFYGGFGDYALHLTISPVEMVDINIAVPFFNKGGEAQYIYKNFVAQLDFKLDFGNIALTYTGAENKLTTDISDPDDPQFDAQPGKIFAYFGLTSIENLGVDVGIGFPFPLKDKDTLDPAVITRVSPISAGLGVKFDTGSFGIKARVVASFAGSTKTDQDGAIPLKDPLVLIADILPFFAVSDTLRIFFSAGLGITGETKFDGEKVADSAVGWHINPYVEVGGEWGPKFLAGIQISSKGKWAGDVPNKDADAVVNWSIPLALSVGF